MDSNISNFAARNQTCVALEEDPTKLIVDYSMNAVLTFGGTALNVVALCAMRLGVKDFLPVHRLLVGLGVSDILALTSAWPRLLYTGCDCISKKMIHAWEIFVRLLAYCNLLGLALDQYIAISKPLHYGLILTKTRVYLFTAVIYIVSYVIAHLNMIIGLLRWLIDPAGGDCRTYIFKATGTLMGSILLSVLLMVTIIITTFYLLVLYEIRKMSKNQNNFNRNYIRSCKKAIKLTSLVIGSFIVFFTPLAVCYYVEGAFHTYLIPAATWWSMLNSLCDPLLYSFRMKDVRNGYEKMFLRKRPRRQQVTVQSCPNNQGC